MTAHDGGQVSLAAQFAFRRAWQLAPAGAGTAGSSWGLPMCSPAIWPTAKIAWLRALALTPRDAPYRVDIAERLVMIDQFQAMTAGMQPGP